MIAVQPPLGIAQNLKKSLENSLKMKFLKKSFLDILLGNKHKVTSLALWKHHINLLLQSFPTKLCNNGVSTKLN